MNREESIWEVSSTGGGPRGVIVRQPSGKPPMIELKTHQNGSQNSANQSLRPVQIVENLTSKLLSGLAGLQNEQHLVAAGLFCKSMKNDRLSLITTY
jgi:hypothetical protein